MDFSGDTYLVLSHTQTSQSPLTLATVLCPAADDIGGMRPRPWRYRWRFLPSSTSTGFTLWSTASAASLGFDTVRKDTVLHHSSTPQFYITVLHHTALCSHLLTSSNPGSLGCDLEGTLLILDNSLDRTCCVASSFQVRP